MQHLPAAKLKLTFSFEAIFKHISLLIINSTGATKLSDEWRKLAVPHSLLPPAVHPVHPPTLSSSCRDLCTPPPPPMALYLLSLCWCCHSSHHCGLHSSGSETSPLVAAVHAVNASHSQQSPHPQRDGCGNCQHSGGGNAGRGGPGGRSGHYSGTGIHCRFLLPVSHWWCTDPNGGLGRTWRGCSYAVGTRWDS